MEPKSFARERRAEARALRQIFVLRIVISLLIIAAISGVTIILEHADRSKALLHALMGLPVYCLISYFFFPYTHDPTDVYCGWAVEGKQIWRVNRIMDFWYAVIFMAPGCFIACTLRDCVRAAWEKYRAERRKVSQGKEHRK